jgi:hypothetical protein
MSMVERAYSIILGPSEEWDVIANERVSAGGIFIGYAMIFAAIPVVIETMIIAYFGKDFAYSSATSGTLQRVGITPFVLMGALKYATALLTLLLMCFFVNSVSAMFNGWSNMVPGTKLMIYASTPMWVAGPISMIPYIGPLITFIAATYVIYLINVGLQPVLGVPAEMAKVFTGLFVLIYVGVWFLSKTIYALVLVMALGLEITKSLP